MTIPANLDAESNRWGSTPVTTCWGPQGGPYTPANTGNGLPVQGSEPAGQSGGSINPVLTGRLDGSGNVQADSGNQDLTLLSSAARTTATSSAWQSNRTGRGVVVYLNVTAASGTGGLTVNVNGLDPVSGNLFTVFTDTPAITATGSYVIRLYPGIGTGNHYGGATPLPATWQVKISVGDSSSYTYSVGASVIL